MRHKSKLTATAKLADAAKGFSLIELLIVVAIILIIAAIAIPSFLRSRMAATEASAAANSRTIVSANITYYSTYGNGFSPDLGSLGGPAGTVLATCDAALLIDNTLSNNGVGFVSTKSGYTYTYTPGAALPSAPNGCANPGLSSFQLETDPVFFGVTGIRRYFVDSSGVIRYTSDGSVPNINSPALQ